MADVQPTSETTTFESAMERLENIVAKMESAQMPLDELLVSYEEGNLLIGICQQKLQAAEQRIEMVARKNSEPSLPAKTSSKSISQPAPDVSLF